MNLSEIAQHKFGNGIDNFTDEFHKVITDSTKTCNSDSVEVLIGFLDGDIEWQGSVLDALANKCAELLDEKQLNRIEQMLNSEDSSIRRGAAHVLSYSRKWPNEALMEALLHEKKKTVVEPMLAFVLGLAGVPDRQSVKLAMQTVASGTPITRQFVDDLIAEHKGAS